MCMCACVCVCVVVVQEIVRLRIRWGEMDVPVSSLRLCDGVKVLLNQLLCPHALLRLTADSARVATDLLQRCNCRTCWGGRVAYLYLHLSDPPPLTPHATGCVCP